jgi:hypothetical protein
VHVSGEIRDVAIVVLVEAPSVLSEMCQSLQKFKKNIFYYFYLFVFLLSIFFSRTHNDNAY